MTPEARAKWIKGEIIRRWKLLKSIEEKGEQALAMAHYAHHPVDWINDWCWTYDPRNAPQELPVYLPMRLCERQEELIRWMRHLRATSNHGWVPKSRGTGASYLADANALHAWRFEPGYSASLVSMTEDDVDSKDDPDTLFQKLRIMLAHLPQWMRPEGFEVGGPYDNHRRLVNPENGNIISGKIGSNPGRGGRSSETYVDEAAHIDHLTEARRALYEKSSCVIEMSTFNGVGEPFHNAVRQGGGQVFWIKWHHIPWYTQEWYEKKKKQYERSGDMAGFAQEIEADPTSSVEGLVIPALWVESARQWRPPEDYEPTEQARYGLDIADGGKNLSVMIRRHGCVVDRLYERQQGGTTKTARWAREHMEREEVDLIIYDGDGIGAAVGDAWGSDDEPPTFERVAFHGGTAPSDFIWPNEKTSAERFVNLKAESWWMLRMAFMRTHERLLWEQGHEDGVEHDPDECISLQVDDPELIMQLSQPKYEQKARNKVAIESKKDLKARGIDSPDKADALVMAWMYFVEWNFAF